ncbi:glycosyltransferase family 4 protein [Algoriphagus terrigena]|uniref:glycosyltransferase family 4 protein n=1 Tax=Algoriphagus terrigena TaxID=344884 RepID=UPI0004025654|nr:glycosyltransferase family 4 protein [Algoriphagus terrigena]
MTFLIVTHVVHKSLDGKIYGYAPYIREMNLWIPSFSKVILIAPILEGLQPNPIEIPYEYPNIEAVAVHEIDLTHSLTAARSFWALPRIVFKLAKAMNQADHIHLRCPGNMGLLGCLVQILFPAKKKTAKYAGNWDPKSDQPFTYKLQQKILNNPLLTKNMKALVYGNWPGTSDNILPFFTATYSESEIEEKEKSFPAPGEPLRLIFVGSLVSGKNPMVALESLKLLVAQGFDVHLDVCGSGAQEGFLREFIRENQLAPYVTLHGNVDAATLKKYYQNAHFLIFLSDSEGWPKVVAEAMFFGCLPITTSVSCVPDMLGFGQRGDLIQKEPQQVYRVIEYYTGNPEAYRNKSNKAREWSNHYTLELFQSEILKLV